MSNSDNKMTADNNNPGAVIKTESGLATSGRLSSFKAPRDLMLNNLNSNKQLPKKVFTPNLNVARNKNKHLLIVDTSKQRRKGEKHDRHEKNDRSKSGNQNKGPGVLRSSGVFSEGIAAGPKRYHLRENYSGGYSKDGLLELKKPVFRDKTDKKVEKDFEGLKIKDFMSDDESEDEFVDSQSLPIRLPLVDSEGLFLTKKQEKVLKTPQGSQELLIKTEPGDEVLISTEENLPNTKTINHAVKLETGNSNVLLDCIQNPVSSLLLLQFPDSLPGRGPDVALEAKDKNAKVGETPQETVPNVCTFNDLEEGQIGKIQIFKSGKIKLLIGDTYYDLSLGSLSNYRQDVMSISTNQEEHTGTMINLGEIKTKLIATPKWENLCENNSSI